MSNLASFWCEISSDLQRVGGWEVPDKESMPSPVCVGHFKNSLCYPVPLSFYPTPLHIICIFISPSSLCFFHFTLQGFWAQGTSLLRGTMACWTRSRPCAGLMKTLATLEGTQKESPSLAREPVPPAWTFSSSPTIPRVRFFHCHCHISSHIPCSKGINNSGQCG